MASYILKSYKLKQGPFSIFRKLKAQRNCFFLDSSLNPGPLARFSILGFEPFYILASKNQPAFLRLRQLLEEYRFSPPGISLPFLAGAVGYLSYDLGFCLEEKIIRRPKPDLGIADLYFAFYNSSVILDHRQDKLYIFCCGAPEKNPSVAAALAKENLKKIEKLLAGPTVSDAHFEKGQPLGLSSNFTKAAYIRAVKEAKEYIRQGDIYQVNLSQQFCAGTNYPAFDIYRRLRSLSPSPFSAYLDAGFCQILSSSPERFLRLNRNMVTTRPMKGTRPRLGDLSKDRPLRRQLIESAKDKAELMMIVDLERNDLGRVCDYRSVKVDKLRQIEEYSTVFQATANISGCLYKDKDRVDLIKACFPGGSITGCPKIRAMEIIEELEPSRRSIYTGCLGYLGFGGDMDLNILIRSILKIKDKLYFGAGGGIVADSLPEAEYEETMVKAKAMIEAVR